MKKLFSSLLLVILFFMVTSCSKKYTISYYVDNDLYHVQENQSNDEINLLTDISKEGYIFEGWTLKDGTLFNEKNMPKKNIELYAKFTIEEDENVEKIVINLEDGRKIYLDLYKDVAPITVENFMKLIDMNYFAGTIFHRVIKDFMIQGGGYGIKNNTIVDMPNVPTIKGEFASNGVQNDLKHVPGVISMARTNDKNSATSQFFICSSTSPHLDGEYAAFGKVSDEDSLKVVMDISNVRTGYLNPMFADFPYNPIIITSIERA